MTRHPPESYASERSDGEEDGAPRHDLSQQLSSRVSLSPPRIGRTVTARAATLRVHQLISVYRI
jgi:hypothetical protein